VGVNILMGPDGISRKAFGIKYRLCLLTERQSNQNRAVVLNFD
jgi:hypothetical protein